MKSFLILLSRAGLFLMIVFYAQASFSKPDSKGKLPRGKFKAATQPKKQKESTSARSIKREKGTEVCHQYHMNPQGGEIFSTTNTQTIYYLARKKVLSEEKRGLIKGYKYSFYRINYSKVPMTVKKVFSTNARSTVSILPHGVDVDGVSILSYQGPNTGCYEGVGSGISIPMESAGKAMQKKVLRLKPSKTISMGEYKTVEGLNSRFYADIKKSFLREIDIVSFQKRSVFRYKNGETPIFWESGKKYVFTWKSLPKRIISRYQSIARRKPEQLELLAGEKLVQLMSSFGVVTLKDEKNILNIKHVPKWTFPSYGGVSYDIQLPKKYRVSDAGLSVNFIKRIAVVYGGNPESKKNWNRLFVHDYQNAKLLSEFKIKRTSYCSAAFVEPKGKFVVAVLQERSNDLHSNLLMYSVAENKWFYVPLKG